MIRAIAANVPIDQIADRAAIRQMIERLKASMQSPAGGILGQLAQRRLTELLQDGGMIELIEQWSRQDNADMARESLVNTLRERMIRITTDEMSRRLSLMQWVIYVITAALFLSPALFLIT